MSDDKECFFIAPIDDSEVREHSNKVMEYLVKEVVSEYGYSATRADRIDKPGSITNQVIEKTVNSELVIVDLTYPDPTVFYQLAVRHTTSEPYIQLIKSGHPSPFDVSGLKTIKYRLEGDKAEQAKNEIRGLLEQLEGGELEFDNPISESAEMQSLRENVDLTNQNFVEILEMIYELDNKMEELEDLIVSSNTKYTPTDIKHIKDSPSIQKSSFNEMENRIYNIIKLFQEEGQNCASKDELLPIAKQMDMSEDELEEVLTELMTSGHLYQTAHGRYRSFD